MAVVPLSYCNASLGKQITFDFDNVTKVISNSVVGGDCSTPQPTVILYDYGPTGLVFAGFVYPMNVAPYAYHVPVGAPVGCLLDITSVDVNNATNNLTPDGSMQINISGANLITDYSKDGGATWQSSNIFTDLLPGTYNVMVRTRGIVLGAYCYDSQNVVVGFDAMICDLALGTIVTTSAGGGVDGEIKVVTVLGYPAPVEYRLDGGAWQDSAEFTGLVADTYNVQVRYKDFPACTDDRDVVVADTESCDLAILDVQIAHEQTKYGDDGALYIVAESSAPPYLYSIDGGDSYQTSPYFLGLSPGEYDVLVVDSNGCSDERTIEVLRYRLATVVYPLVNGLRAVVKSGPMVPANARQNFENTLFSEMRIAGVDCNCYSEKLELNDARVIQFRSSYGSNLVRLYDESGVLITTLTPVKKTANLGLTEELDAFFADGGAGTTQIFFENGIPLFIEVGQDITIDGVPALNGTYQITDRRPGIGAAEGYEVLIVELVYSGPSSSLGTVTIEYDLEPYEVFEFTVFASLLGAGKFYFTIVGDDPQFAPYLVQSEPIEIALVWPDHLLMKYKSFDNCKQINYDTGIQHEMRVLGELRNPTYPSERAVYTDSKDRLRKLESYVRQIFEMKLYDIPFFVIARVALAQDSDYFEVDGVEYQTEENIEPAHFDNDALSNTVSKVRQVNFAGDNSDDQGASTGSDILGDNDTVLGVP